MERPIPPDPHQHHDPAHDDDARAAKSALRRSVREAIARMDAHARAHASARICEQINLSEPMRSAGCVMVFDALADEPDVSEVASAALARGKTVCYPRIDWDKRTLTPVAVPDLGFVRTTERHGVREPVGGREVRAWEVDLVIVPGVAFDGRGGRLGRGGGFYDRFLEMLAERARAHGDAAGHGGAVGVCFECQRVERVPREGHDASVSLVVTETGVFSVSD